jgi:ring-1,2-phenylacetyl-CoA epoxidase subunit PaaE
MTFYPLKVKDIRQETSDCVSVSFAVPKEWATYFAFQQGQYLTLKTRIEGKEMRRSYSICTAPDDNDLRVAIKQVEKGKFSTYANNELKTGDILEVMPPMGHFFTPLSKNNVQNYIFFAAGSGITPVISNIKAILRTEPQSQCTLFYGNQRVSSIIFKEELEALKNQHLRRFQIFNVLSRERTESDLLNGRLDREKISQFIEKIPNILRASPDKSGGGDFFSCGPFEMTEAVKELLLTHGIDEKNIHFELFNAPKIAKKNKPINSAIKSHAFIKMDGLTIEVPIERGQNILDAAQLVGADVPYACKGGVCCTCRAKLIEGEIEMQVNYSLTKEEVAQGFILTCQAVPKTKKVVVDFDIK